MRPLARSIASALIALASASPLAPARAGPEADPAAAAPRLVVVAPTRFHAALAPYVAVRARTLAVDLVALETAIEAEEGADAPERLKRFLYRGWRERGVRYALLVGDADTLPVRFMMLDRVAEGAYDTAFYPSDLYYADVARADGSFDDWNARREGHHAGYFGEVHGEHHKDPPVNYDEVSYLPEIAVGRWPVSDEAALAAVVAKTVAWEERAAALRAAGDGGRAPRLLMAHGGGWVDARSLLGDLADGLAAAGWDVDRQFYGERDPTGASVRAALAAGVEVAVHAGHGGNDGWDGCLGPAEMAALADAPPAVLFSTGCETAHFCTEPPYHPYLDVTGAPHPGTGQGEVFDVPPPPPAPIQPDPYNQTSLGERSVRQERGGAVAYIGCNTGSQPCALTLLAGFLEALAAHPHERLGDAWNRAIAHYWEAERLADLVPTEDWYPASIFFQGMKFMLFGDPALPMP